MLNKNIKKIAEGLLPEGFRKWLWLQKLRLIRNLPSSMTYVNTLREMNPASRVFGLDRGTPVDRYYIEQFLMEHKTDIKGHVLEIGDDTYTRKFWNNEIQKSTVLSYTKENPKTTLVADLTRADNIASNTFHCILITQTLQFIYDIRSAVHNLYRILQPGGIVLATVPGISQISRFDMQRWGDYWRFTSLSAREIFKEAFPPHCIEVKTHGNAFAAISFLYGIAAEELKKEELDLQDEDYEVLITLRAVKSNETS